MLLDLQHLSTRTMSRHGPALFATVRNEIFHMPRFLAHYRRMGVVDFLIYDDSSTDGTRELLLDQPDVSVVTSNIPYGQIVINGFRWPSVLKAIVPAQMFERKWVVVADADEYLVLPQPYADIAGFAQWLDRRGNLLVAAVLVDCYPASLAARGADPLAALSERSPYFDRGPLIRIDNRESSSQAIITGGVRARLERMLRERFPQQSAALFESGTWTPAKLWKVPLIRSGSEVMIMGPHGSTLDPPTDVLLALLHYKFTPDLDAKIDYALRSRAYYNQSQEYRFLDLAVRLLADEPLICAQTVSGASPQSLTEAGFLRCPETNASRGRPGPAN